MKSLSIILLCTLSAMFYGIIRDQIRSRMRRAWFGLIFLGLAGVALMPGICQAYISLPVEPIANHFALSDCVVVGKIVSIGDKPEKGVLYRWGKGVAEFAVVEVETSEILSGSKESKRVKLAFLSYQMPGMKPAPQVGLEGLFFGVRTPDEKFNLVPVGAFHDSRNDAYNKKLEQARRCARLLEKPEAGLASRNGSDKLLTAYILVLRDTYCQVRKGGELKAEPMEGERSKQIMLALAEGDWSDKESGANAGNALSWLRHSPIKPPQDFPAGVSEESDKAAVAKARRWLTENAKTYQLQRLSVAR